LDTPLPELDPAWLFEQRWQQEVLRVASDELRAELSPENLQIFEGRLVQGLPVAEIASTLQMTSEQIWSRQRWLCRRLRARLDLYTGNPFGFEENTKSA
jgi:DNA-directed RNA polymerase specialized sigma24 family protein